MIHEIKDFYFSQRAFEAFGSDHAICEVLINGTWKLFTEQIPKGIPALSKWSDLIYLGSSNETRYSNYSDWIVLQNKDVSDTADMTFQKITSGLYVMVSNRRSDIVNDVYEEVDLSYLRDKGIKIKVIETNTVIR